MPDPGLPRGEVGHRWPDLVAGLEEVKGIEEAMAACELKEACGWAARTIDKGQKT